MNLDDYILISRNDNVYKCQIRALSSCFCFIEAKNKLISEIYDLSALMVETEMMFPLSHYTRAEMSNKFYTIEEKEALKEDATYVLKTTAAAEIAKLILKSTVSSDFKDCSEHCLNNILGEEYRRINNMLTFEPEDVRLKNYLGNPSPNIEKMYNHDNL